jgi:hypothetical protein
MTLAIVLSNRHSLYLPAALASIREHVAGVSYVIVVDDSGDAAWRHELDLADGLELVRVDDEPAGYTRAMAKVWEVARTAGDRFLFVEEDFQFRRPVDLAELHTVLHHNPSLAQVALQRAPWYRNEKACGSVIKAQLERVARERGTATLTPKWISGSVLAPPSLAWVEHDAGITCNPSLWSTAVLEHDWPQVEWSETAMGDRLRDDGLISAWFGKDGDEPHVEHVGAHRSATSTGY